MTATTFDGRLGRLQAALAGVQLDYRDEQVLRWLAQWNDQVGAGITSLIARARAAGTDGQSPDRSSNDMSPAEHAMRWALFQAPISPGLSWILAAVASHTGPDGIARATMRELERETLHPETQLVPALAQLSVHGLITRVEANPPAWQLHTDRVRGPLAELAGPLPDVTHSSPKPSTTRPTRGKRARTTADPA